MEKKLYLAIEIRTKSSSKQMLKDGNVLCRLINAIEPGSVKKINTMNVHLNSVKNIEMYLKACVARGLKEQDLFQVNDLYENENLYI